MSYDEIATHLWATDDEAFASWVTQVVGHVHCRICGSPSGLCYLICPNSEHYYTPEQEKADSLWQEAMPDSEWMSLAVTQYEQAHGFGSYCS